MWVRVLPPARLGPIPRGALSGTIDVAKQEPVAAQYRACGQCHPSDDGFRPGFVAGDERQSPQQLRACALL
jgi:hypothetical protein